MSALPPPRAAKPDRTGATTVKRVTVATASILVAINIWTGCPLLALWIGSRVASRAGGLSMLAVAVVVVTLAMLTVAMTVLLAWLSGTYDELIDRPLAARRTSPWLRSMRGEREKITREQQGITATERAIIGSVVACTLTFEVWLFFFAGSSLPSA
jgi:hypothetical protein